MDSSMLGQLPTDLQNRIPILLSAAFGMDHSFHDILMALAMTVDSAHFGYFGIANAFD
jgi:hypothetical protein